MTDVPAEQLETEQSMFVQTATGVDAVLSFLEPDAGEPDDAVVVLTDPSLGVGGDLSYSIEA